MMERIEKYVNDNIKHYISFINGQEKLNKVDVNKEISRWNSIARNVKSLDYPDSPTLQNIKYTIYRIIDMLQYKPFKSKDIEVVSYSHLDVENWFNKL